MTDGLHITAYGKPVTQGSKTRTHYGMRDDNERTLRPWREAVKAAALDVMATFDRYDTPLRVRLVFTFDRPGIHYRTGRNANLLRDGAPRYPANVRSGDVDKLQRACFDALTDAGVWRDDAQVVDVRARKVWANEDEMALHIPGVRIHVAPMGDDHSAAQMAPAAAEEARLL